MLELFLTPSFYLFLEVSETALKTVTFLHHASLFNRSWSGNSCRSFVRVKIYHYNVGFSDDSLYSYAIAYTLAILFFTGISGWTFFIINIERYFSIIHPALHRNHFTKRRFLLTWVFFCFVDTSNVLSRIYSKFSTKVIPITLSVGVFTSLYTYIAIFIVARKKMLNVHNNSNQRESSRNLMAFLRELKMAKTYVLVVFFCFLCFLPIVVLCTSVRKHLTV